MGAIAVGLRENVAARFWDSTNGKKAVMAVTGVILFGFVVGHMVGNLQVYEGPEVFNNYARVLRLFPIALWVVRLTLLASVALHITATVQLALRKNKARPVAYSKRESIASTYSSRTMYWSGPIILAFVIYHLLQFTFGVTAFPTITRATPTERSERLSTAGSLHLLHHRDDAAVPAPASRRVEHVSVARHQSPAVHAMRLLATAALLVAIGFIPFLLAC